MPFLNTERYIQESIESVLAQTYPYWELMLIDDGSTDGSTSIARRYAGEFGDRIRYLHHPGHVNRGGSISRNVGIEHSRGRYVALLDADDVFLPEKLERQIPLLEEMPAVGALYGATEYWYGWTGLAHDAELDHVVPPNIPTERVYEPPDLIRMIYVEKSAAVPCTCSFVVRRSVLDETGFFEPAFHHLYVDQVLYTKIFAATPAYVMADCLDRYRQHADSSCNVAKRSGEREQLRLEFLAWQVDYLTNHSHVPPMYPKVIRRMMRELRFPVLSRIASFSKFFPARLLKPSEPPA